MADPTPQEFLQHLTAQAQQPAVPPMPFIPPTPVISQAPAEAYPHDTIQRGANMLPGETYEQYNARMAAESEATYPKLTPPDVNGSWPPATDAALAAAVHGTPELADIDQLIATLRTATGLVEGSQLALSANRKVEAPVDVHQLITQLTAEGAEAARLKNLYEKRAKQVTDFLKAMLGDNTVLTVNQTPMFTITKVTSRVIDQKYIASLFPDLPDGSNDAFWTDQAQKRSSFK